MKRKRRYRPATPEVMTAAVNTMIREGGGALQMTLYTLPHVPLLFACAAGGDATAYATLRLLKGALQEYGDALNTKYAKTCFCCDGAMSDIAAIAIVMSNHDATTAIAGVVCDRCHGTDDEMAERVLKAWRETIDPTVRKIVIHPTAVGRA